MVTAAACLHHHSSWRRKGCGRAAVKSNQHDVDDIPNVAEVVGNRPSREALPGLEGHLPQYPHCAQPRCHLRYCGHTDGVILGVHPSERAAHHRERGQDSDCVERDLAPGVSSPESLPYEGNERAKRVRGNRASVSDLDDAVEQNDALDALLRAGVVAVWVDTRLAHSRDCQRHDLSRDLWCAAMHSITRVKLCEWIIVSNQPRVKQRAEWIHLQVPGLGTAWRKRHATRFKQLDRWFSAAFGVLHDENQVVGAASKWTA
eukprot:SAG11_NODE_3029_length_2753_cov_8.497739_4_plen_260_part_00